MIDLQSKPIIQEQVMNSKPILVLGATGKTGRRIVSILESSGHDVRRGSRSATPSG